MIKGLVVLGTKHLSQSLKEAYIKHIDIYIYLCIFKNI